MTYVPDDATALCIGDKYEIVYDPSDSSTIFILENGRFLPAKLSSKFDDFQGLSWSEIREQKKTQQKNRQAAQQSEVAASVAATQAVQSIIQAAEQRREEIQDSLTGEKIARNRETERSKLT